MSNCKKIKQLIAEYNNLKEIIPLLSEEEKLSKLRYFQKEIVNVLKDNNCKNCTQEIKIFWSDFSFSMN